MSQQYVRFGEFLGQLALRTFDKGYVHKKPLRKEWVAPAAAPMFVGTLVFQSGAVLGDARRDKTDALASLLGLQRRDPTVPYADSIRSLGQTWLENRKREAESLHDVWNLAQFPDTDLRDFNTLKQLTKAEIRLDELLEALSWAAIYGVAFGLAYPNEFRRLWRLSFETPVDPAKWSRARSAGLAIPERQEAYPLATAETDTLHQTAAYVRAYRPELLEPLNLRSYGTE